MVLTDAVKGWPAWSRWTLEYLQQHCGADRLFEAGAAKFTMEQYWKYAAQTTEENPLYLFDKKFGESVPQLVADYAAPGCMADNLFSLLGAEARPDFRWLIIGAPRSGSTFHIDPNGTSAWNACLTGQ